MEGHFRRQQLCIVYRDHKSLESIEFSIHNQSLEAVMIPYGINSVPKCYTVYRVSLGVRELMLQF